MRAIFIFVVLLPTSVVYGEIKNFEENIQNESVQQIKSLNLIVRRKRSVDEFSANEADEEFEEDLDIREDEESVQEEIACEEFKNFQSLTTNQKVVFEVITPQSIRYKEVTKVDVMIYNNINSRKSLDVELNISDDCGGCNIQYLNNKCSSQLENESELTKIITVPYGRARYVSFYIQTKTNHSSSPDFINLKLKASIRDENYKCSFSKRVNIEPPKVKMYEISVSNYKLSSSNNPKELSISFNPTYDRKLRMSIEVTGNRTLSTYTNFTVTITNENNFNKVVHVTDSNADTPVEVFLPENSRNVRVSAKGSGFCSSKIISENSIRIKYPNPKFNLTVTPLPSSNKSEGIVRVCAVHDPFKDEFAQQNLYSVVYDVEMPSGYIYKELIDRNKNREIKNVEPRWKNSRVQIYFNDFISNKNYCVDVRAMKIKETSNAVDAVVIVYDYEDKDNLAAEYYNFNGICGSS